jgi:hypothetical protein
MGSYRQPAKRKIETLLPESVVSSEDLEVIKKRAKFIQNNECVPME